jgi:hypothetical protein
MSDNDYGKKYPGSGTVNPYHGMTGKPKPPPPPLTQDEKDLLAGQSPEWIERRNDWAKR